MEGLKREMRGVRAAIEDKSKALQEEHAQRRRQYERWLAQLEVRPRCAGRAGRG